MKPRFSNVDLVIRSKTSLELLVEEMGKRVIVLHCGPVRGGWLAILEKARPGKGPDAVIRALCALVERLSPASKRLWQAARKEFDAGYAAQSSADRSHFTVGPETVKRVAKLGGVLSVTSYRLSDETPAASGQTKAETNRNL